MREATSRLAAIGGIDIEGQVVGLSGLAVDVGGLAHHTAVGDRITLDARDGRAVVAEIVGFTGMTARAMAFGVTEGIGPGTTARASLPAPPSSTRSARE